MRDFLTRSPSEVAPTMRRTDNIQTWSSVTWNLSEIDEKINQDLKQLNKVDFRGLKSKDSFLWKLENQPFKGYV